MANTSAPPATDDANAAPSPDSSGSGAGAARPMATPLWRTPAAWPLHWLVATLLLTTFTVVLVLQLGFAYGLYGEHLQSSEEAAAQEKAAVLAQTVVAAKSRLTKTVTDYAPWSLSIGYLDGRITDAARRDADSGARLDRLMLDVDAFLGPEHRLVLGYRRDPSHSLAQLKPGLPPKPALPLTQADFEALFSETDLEGHLMGAQPGSGYALAGGRLWLWASAPVLSREQPGTIHGWWVAARDLEVVVNATTNQQLAGHRELVVMPRGTVPPGKPRVIARTADMLRVQTLIGHLDDTHELVLRVESPREASAAFRRTTRYFALTSVIIGLGLALMLLAALNTLVLRPLRQLSRQLEALAQGATTVTELPPAHGGPEIRSLKEAIDSLLQARKAREEAERARDAAREADRQKSEFMATLTHELRNPLHGVLGMTELLAAASLPADQQAQAAVLHGAVVSLKAIADDALTVSTIQAGRMRLNPAPTDIRSMLQGLRELHLQDATRKGLGIECHVDAALRPAYLADESRLRQVIGNLVGNAIKFTQRGAITLAVRLIGDEATPPRLKFSVTDSGPGLAPAFRQRAFDLFSQGPDSQGSVTGGVGLGLGIVKSLVDLMGGHVEVETVQGVGSTFSFTIPLEPTAALPPAPTPQGGTLEPRPCRVLLVDDNAAGRQVSGSLLAHLGAEVTPAASGQEGLDFYTAGPDKFDLVLMDVRMPDMDGHEATRRLREWEAGEGKNRHVQVVALTANSAPSDQLQARAAGMDGYLTKPVRLIDLRNLLRSAQGQTVAAAN